jgi:hypothetical protein
LLVVKVNMCKVLGLVEAAVEVLVKLDIMLNILIQGSVVMVVMD